MTFSTYCSITVLVAAGATLWFLAQSDEIPQPPPVAASAAEQRPAWLAEHTVSVAPTPERPLPLARQVDDLIASGRPEDAFAAFHLIQDCVHFARDGDLFSQGAILPGGVMPELVGLTTDAKVQKALQCKEVSQRMLDARFEHLARAAAAGVRGTALSYYLAGPFGDPSALETRPDDPLVRHWQERAMAQLHGTAQTGDLASLTFFLTHPAGRQGLDAMQQLTYVSALRTVYGSDTLFGSNLAQDAGLTDQQVAQAVDGGKRIAAIVAKRQPLQVPAR